MLNLSKGESIAIANSSGSVVNRVRMGLGWKPLLEAKVPGIIGKLLGKTQSSIAPIDLDASCILFDKDKKVVDKVYFANLTSRVGKIKHSGDDRTGMGGDKGVDNESITVDLGSLPAEVEAIVFVVNSFTGQTFETVGDAYVGLIDEESGERFANFNLTSSGKHTAQIMGKMYRHNGGWKFKAIGEAVKVDGRTVEALIGPSRDYL